MCAGIDLERETDLCEELAPARRCGGKNEPHQASASTEMDGLHHMCLARLESDRVLGGVSGLDAKHVAPAVVGHVGETSVRPRIPDDCRVGIGLGDGNATMQRGIVDDDGRCGVEVRAIRRPGEGEDGFGLCLAREVVVLVEELGLEEAVDACLFDVADVQIGMQRFFDVQRFVAVVGDREAQAEFAAEGDLPGDEEVVEAERAAEFGGPER